ncbi:hypothetical protein D3C86_1660410 [compost metagenome]
MDADGNSPLPGMRSRNGVSGGGGVPRQGDRGIEGQAIFAAATQGWSGVHGEGGHASQVEARGVRVDEKHVELRALVSSDEEGDRHQRASRSPLPVAAPRRRGLESSAAQRVPD